MDGGDTAQLLYLSLLIVAISGTYLVSQRRNLGKKLTVVGFEPAQHAP